MIFGEDLENGRNSVHSAQRSYATQRCPGVDSRVCFGCLIYAELQERGYIMYANSFVV